MSAASPNTEIKYLAQSTMRIAGDALDVIALPSADQWKILALIRFDMLRALNEFLNFKDSDILLPIIQSGDPTSVRKAIKLSESNHAIQDEYDTFVLRWPLANAQSIAGDYPAELTAVMTRIAGQVALDLQALEILARNLTMNTPI